MDKRRVYIVWNEGQTEGVVFTDQQDAWECQSRDFGVPYSTLGSEFSEEIYEGHELTLETADLDTPAQQG